MAESIFVSDGCTFKGSVPASPGVHPAVTFTYRPATFGVRSEYAAASPSERAAVACQIMSRQVKEVRVEGADDVVRLTPDQAAKLHAGLFSGIFDAVMGYVGPAADAEKN